MLLKEQPTTTVMCKYFAFTVKATYQHLVQLKKASSHYFNTLMQLWVKNFPKKF